jgi:hypothetical protein
LQVTENWSAEPFEQSPKRPGRTVVRARESDSERDLTSQLGPRPSLSDPALNHSPHHGTRRRATTLDAGTSQFSEVASDSCLARRSAREPTGAWDGWHAVGGLADAAHWRRGRRRRVRTAVGGRAGSRRWLERGVSPGTRRSFSSPASVPGSR